ncbi:MAG: FHA domain-containing protein [Anaerolineales bacterium]|nr:FHA domain-containing protein [Anaerolineales bacterium]HEY62883.1 FHA domain-containing protein [Anaerolineae bacterium]
MQKNISRLLILSIFFLLFSTTAFGQNSENVSLELLEDDQFPEISLSMRVFNAQWDFIHNLTSKNIVIQEDSNIYTPISVNKSQPGSQIIFALNLGSSFAIRNSQGISRFDMVKAALLDWGKEYSKEEQDDFSIVASDGTEFTHLNAIQEWNKALTQYNPDPRDMTPSLDILAKAIDLASDPPKKQGMGKAIIFLTPPPKQSSFSALKNLGDMAVQQNARIFVWMISSPTLFDSQAANELRDLAIRTHGQFFAFSGVETFPGIETTIDPTRYFYEIRYHSEIKESGSHSVSVKVQTAEATYSSQLVTFDLQVLPPNPIFVSPPLEIIRSVDKQKPQDQGNLTTYIPLRQKIDIIIEFPDKHPRRLKRTTLFVDGVPTEENIAEPFNTFSWDLTPYNSTGEHILQVEAEDTLGLRNKSIETPVKIKIQYSPFDLLIVIRQNILLVGFVLSAILLGGLIFLMIIKGKIHPRHFGRLQQNTLPKFKQTTEQKTKPSHPQKPKTKAQKHKGFSWFKRIRIPEKKIQPQSRITAYLQPIENIHGKKHPKEIDLGSYEITFGSNAVKSKIHLNDPSVDNLHARITSNQAGNHWIFDNNSVAGTWVNYQQIPKEGKQLEHSDIIFMGRIEFRYLLKDATNYQKRIITTMEKSSGTHI